MPPLRYSSLLHQQKLLELYKNASISTLAVAKCFLNVDTISDCTSFDVYIIFADDITGAFELPWLIKACTFMHCTFLKCTINNTCSHRDTCICAWLQIVKWKVFGSADTVKIFVNTTIFSDCLYGLTK